MHVHSAYSGMCTLPVLNRLCRESYSPPEAVYQTLRRRHMDLVTLTDHDSIEGAELLRSKDDFFMSEEVTCTAPSGTEVHVGVYGIDERHHVELQRRRRDLPRFAAYLRERRLFATINHPFSALTGQRHTEDFDWFSLFPAVEVLNAHLAPANNAHAERFAEINAQVAVGGSDAHTLASAGSAWTEVPGARNKDEFLAGLRCGRGFVGGRCGTYLKLTSDVFRIAAAMMAEAPWLALLTPLLAAAPVLTFVNAAMERAFAQRFGSMILNANGQSLFSGKPQRQEFVA